MTVAMDSQAVSAIVQAASAVAVAVMTFYLVRFTGRYVAEMKTSNQLQEQANMISSQLLGRAAREDAPFLIAVPGGGSGQTGGAGDTGMTVQNRGGGLAHDITVESSWGSYHLDSLAAGERANVMFHTDTGYLADREPPKLIRFRFSDAQGNHWFQEPNMLPVRED
jgi:hypothetical protein